MNIKCGELKFNINCDKNWNIPKNVEKFIVEQWGLSRFKLQYRVCE